MCLTNQNPKFFGWIYVAIIPIFATIYFFLPSSNFGGDLANSMNSFVTCLYYSTVTITTLGYGDISAKSHIVQILVILETVLGVITIGLFLNSLSIQKSKEISLKEKKKETAEKFKQECEKILRHNKIIEQNIDFYLIYTSEITNPINSKKTRELNPEFSFNDMKDLYKQSMRLTDNFQEPAVKHYFTHQKNLELSIKELVLNINFSYWKDLEEECMTFLSNSKTYDFSSSILSLPNLMIGSTKGIEEASKMIESHTGALEFKDSNIINQFIALYILIKGNLEFINIFREKMNQIKSNIA